MIKKIKSVETYYDKQGRKEKEVHVRYDSITGEISSELYSISYIDDNTYKKIYCYDQTKYVTVIEDDEGNTRMLNNQDSVKYLSYNEKGKLVELSEKSDLGKIVTRNEYDTYGSLSNSLIEEYNEWGELISRNYFNIEYFSNTVIYKFKESGSVYKLLILDKEGRVETETYDAYFIKYLYDRKGRIYKTETFIND